MYSITILRRVLCGEVIWVVDKVNHDKHFSTDFAIHAEKYSGRALTYVQNAMRLIRELKSENFSALTKRLLMKALL